MARDQDRSAAVRRARPIPTFRWNQIIASASDLSRREIPATRNNRSGRRTNFFSYLCACPGLAVDGAAIRRLDGRRQYRGIESVLRRADIVWPAYRHAHGRRHTPGGWNLACQPLHARRLGPRRHQRRLCQFSARAQRGPARAPRAPGADRELLRTRARPVVRVSCRQAFGPPAAHHAARHSLSLRFLARFLQGTSRNDHHADGVAAAFDVPELAAGIAADPVHGRVYRRHCLRHPQDGDGANGRRDGGFRTRRARGRRIRKCQADPELCVSGR